jgi:cytochrome c biogenesis protein CcmG/thiol:disulfide interchange protein DsbE
VKRWLVAAIPLVVLIAVASLFAFYALKKADTRVEPDFTVGKPAPAMMLPYLEGGPPVALLSEIKGPALVNIFASWCVPCAVEAPYLETLRDKGIRIVGIDQGKEGMRDPPQEVAAFLARYGDPFAVILNDEKALAMVEFGATGVPETFVIDSHGKIVGKHTGPIGDPRDPEASAAAVERLAAMVRNAD